MGRGGVVRTWSAQGAEMRGVAAGLDQAGSVSQEEELRFSSRWEASEGFQEKIKIFNLLYVDRSGEQFGGDCRHLTPI